ncbi:diguanylate cyclase [Candidatus Omnitrophota bacterium]
MTASLMLTISLIVLGVSIHDIVLTFIFLGLGSLFGYYLRVTTDRVMLLKDKILNDARNEENSVTQTNKKLSNDKLYLEKAVYDISSLYQAPKAMISSISLIELLDALKKSIEGYFNFTRCRILIFSFKDEEPKIEKIFTVPEVNDENGESQTYDNSLLGTLSKKKELLMIDKSAGMAAPNGLELDEQIDSFMAIPLTAGERFNGIFVMEGIFTEDMLRLAILAYQFAMVLERIRLYELVQELAITDGLTKVFVRRYFMERFHEEIERAQNFNTHLSLIMLDLDNFKKCNDEYGHLVGDVVLKETSEVLKQNLREIDIIGRYGGEEFSIILPETTKEAAQAVCERLRGAVENSLIKAYDETIKLTVSAGVTAYPDDTSEPKQLIDKADQMLYRAKSEGKNRVVVYG